MSPTIVRSGRHLNVNATGGFVPPPGYVRLSCDDPTFELVVLLGAEMPTLGAGVGGWEVTPRPRQLGMTTWEGVEPFTLSLPLMFDGYAAHRSQESALRRLVRVARGDDESRPGILTIDGLVLPASEWVVEGIEWGDPIRSRRTMDRTRQALTLQLREYVPPKYLQRRRKALQGAKGKTHIVIVKKGDTPASIARRARCKWTDIRELNASVVHKANQNLRDGSKLRVPTAATRRRKRSQADKGSRKR
jgi:hypothetical protein